MTGARFLVALALATSGFVVGLGLLVVAATAPLWAGR